MWREPRSAGGRLSRADSLANPRGASPRLSTSGKRRHKYAHTPRISQRCIGRILVKGSQSTYRGSVANALLMPALHNNVALPSRRPQPPNLRTCSVVGAVGRPWRQEPSHATTLPALGPLVVEPEAVGLGGEFHRPLSRCYGASGDDIASIGKLLSKRWLHRRGY
jgi:hypothetical protein